MRTATLQTYVGYNEYLQLVCILCNYLNRITGVDFGLSTIFLLSIKAKVIKSYIKLEDEIDR